MRIDLGPEVEAFREEVRGFIGEHRPEGLGEIDQRELARAGERNEALEQWTKTLREHKWLCVSWPEEYGGRGLAALELAVLNQEFAEARVPRVTMGMGESLVGPSIIVHATEEQKTHFLPRIVAGEDRYCQGFSEPNAGSDLAGLQTKGEVHGDEIIITGQKIWTSGAAAANMMFCLCRTDPDAPKHQGISYVLLPMKDNNIELRPIKQITGGSGFYECFIDSARAPLFNVIGGLNNGWRVAMTTLGNERGGGATVQHLRFVGEYWRLVDTARKLGRLDDPQVRQDLAWAYTQIEQMRFGGIRTLAELAAKREPGPEASVNKLFWSEYHKKLGEIAMRIVGTEAIAIDPDDKHPVGARWQGTFLQSRAGTIYAGTSEIQRNIISERALGLPKDPDKDRQKEPVQS